MRIDQYCQPQRCKHVELEQFLACFRVARVCQRQLGFLVHLISMPKNLQMKCIFRELCNCFVLEIKKIKKRLNMWHVGMYISQFYWKLLQALQQCSTCTINEVKPWLKIDIGAETRAVSPINSGSDSQCQLLLTQLTHSHRPLVGRLVVYN